MDCTMEIAGGKPYKLRALLFDNPSPDGRDMSAFIDALKPERLWPLDVGNKIEARYSAGGQTWPVRLYRHRPRASEVGAEGGGGLVASPLAGTLAKVEVAAGQRVAKGELLAVVEAMKMETALLAPFSGTVVGVTCAVGGPVAAGQVVVEVERGGPP